MHNYYTKDQILDTLKTKNPFLFEIGFQIEEISFAGPEISISLRKKRDRIEFIYDQRGEFDIFLIKNKMFFFEKRYLLKLIIPADKYELLCKIKGLDLYDYLNHYSKTLEVFIKEENFFS